MGQKEKMRKEKNRQMAEYKKERDKFNRKITMLFSIAGVLFAIAMVFKIMGSSL